jgi:hypothetical protein
VEDTPVQPRAWQIEALQVIVNKILGYESPSPEEGWDKVLDILDAEHKRLEAEWEASCKPFYEKEGPLLMRRVLIYRSGVTLVGAESSPAPRHSGLHKLETWIDNRTLVPILQR